MHPVFMAIGRGLARITQNSPTSHRLLRRWRFPGKLLIVNLMHPRARRVVAECDGLTFDLELADDVQREIYFGIFEPDELALVTSMIPVGGVCMDIGANVGIYSLQMARRVGVKGRVYAFEPDPRNNARLQRNRQLNYDDGRIEVHQLALSNRSGTAEFFVADDSSTGLGSLCQVTGPNAGKIEVTLTTLDAFMEQHQIDRVDLAKIDVEAHEFEMMEGAAKTMERGAIRYILSEYNGQLLAERDKTFADYLQLFTRSGYRPVRLNMDLHEQLLRGTIDSKTICQNFLFEAPDAAKH